MRSHPLNLLLLAGSVAALSRSDCFSSHSNDLVDNTTCGDRTAVTQCLSGLSSFEPANLQACFVNAGCSASQAARDTEHILVRCDDLARAHELRRKRAPTSDPPASTSFDPDQIVPRDTATPTASPNKNKSGADCFAVGTTSTTSCVTETVNGKVKTKDCKPVPLTTSDCLKGYICTVDSNHVDVCMQAQNSLDTGGIIIASIFAFFIFTGISYLTYACCRERKEHKLTAARAEAVALARAATKKQRSQQARAPLMQQTQDHGPNPFQDQAGHA